MLVISDVHVLITYSMIVESFFIMLSVSSVLYFRYKRPDMHRPIKVSGPYSCSNSTNKPKQSSFKESNNFRSFFQLPLIIPITFFILSAVLMVVPCFAAPYEVLMGLVITIAGIPVYCFGVMWKNKPKFILDAIGMDLVKITIHSFIIIIFPWIFFSQFFSRFDDILSKILVIGQRREMWLKEFSCRERLEKLNIRMNDNEQLMWKFAAKIRTITKSLYSSLWYYTKIDHHTVKKDNSFKL